MQSITIKYYSENAQKFYKKYQARSFEEINNGWLNILNEKQARILDVGAGSGRDALCLAQRGHWVVAVEPADGLRELAAASSNDSIQWIKDQLPRLGKIKELNQKFDLILLNAVWMHIVPKHREEAIRNLAHLLCAGGRLVINLRHGGFSDKRVMYPVSVEELIGIARTNTLEVLFTFKAKDLFGRSDVSWETIVFGLKQNLV